MRLAPLLLLLAACGPFEGDPLNPEEVITTVVLSFTPTTGSKVIAELDDPDGDGGDPPTVQPVNLTAATTYTLDVQFQNRLATIPEDITVEVMDEGDLHLLLFTGSAIDTGVVTHAYADLDANGLPIGLRSTVMARSGSGQLTVTLRHMPPEEPPQKAADTVMLAHDNGIDSIGGSTDASVTFMVTVP